MRRLARHPLRVLHGCAALFVVACLVLARSDADLEPGPEFGREPYPLVLDGERLLACLPVHQKQVGRLPDGVRLYENTAAVFRAAVPESGKVPLSLVARGGPLDGVPPYVTVYVDREFRGGFFVDSKEWGLYRLELDLARGEHRFKIAYVNDRSRYPVSRDLDLRSVAIGNGAPTSIPSYVRWSVPAVVAPARLSRQVYAVREHGALRVWSGGEAGDDVYIPRGGTIPIELRGAASGLAGTLVLSVDDRNEADIRVTGPGIRSHSTTLGATTGWHRFALTYRADLPGTDAAFLLTDLRLGEIAALRAGPGGPLLLTRGDHAVAAADLDLASGADSADTMEGSRVLWSEGFVGRTVIAAAEGAWELTVSARGDVCDGAGPRILVMADDNQIASVQVLEGEVRDYSIPLWLAAGPHEIRLVFDNDANVPGVCDRNLRVDAIGFHPAAAES